jgi:hypothetical protein
MERLPFTAALPEKISASMPAIPEKISAMLVKISVCLRLHRT